MSVNDDMVTMMPKHEDLKDPLEFHVKEIRKYFQVGDHVKVIAGRHEGETGLIVRIETNMAIVFADLTMHEVKVRPRDLQLCLETSSGVDISGHFQLGDLVMIDLQTAGVIIRIEKEMFKVLTQHGKELSVKQHTLQPRKTKAVALDAYQNSIAAKDIVKVIKGSHIGKQGEIRHVYRGFVFIHARDTLENGGIIVSRSKDLELASSTGNAQALSGLQSPRLSSPHPHRGGRGGHRGGGGGRKFNSRDNSIIGKTVKINRGPYKGYIGIVKDATDSTARVELHTNCQTISVDKQRLFVITGQDSAIMMTGLRTPQFGANTPAYASMTPSYGSMTPLPGAGGRTPNYQSSSYMTLSYDPSRTPLHGNSAWDPTITNTPARQDDWYNYDTAPSPVNYNNPATPGNIGTPSPFTSDYKYTPSPSGYSPLTPGSNVGSTALVHPVAPWNQVVSVLSKCKERVHHQHKYYLKVTCLSNVYIAYFYIFNDSNTFS
jgi:transcription elongation factor SPT5